MKFRLHIPRFSVHRCEVTWPGDWRWTGLTWWPNHFSPQAEECTACVPIKTCPMHPLLCTQQLPSRNTLDEIKKISIRRKESSVLQHYGASSRPPHFSQSNNRSVHCVKVCCFNCIEQPRLVNWNITVLEMMLITGTVKKFLTLMKTRGHAV
jgi:hypothetical protein